MTIDPDAKSPTLLFAALRRRKFSILLTASLLSCGVVGFASRMTPSFVATSSVLMQQRSGGVADITTSAGVIALDSVAVRTQTDILRSPELARTIVREFGLIDLPEFSPHEGTLARLLARLNMAHPGAPLSVEQREEIAAQILLGMTTIVNDGRSYVIDIKVKVGASAAAEAAHAAGLSARLSNAYADTFVQFSSRLKSDTIKQANAFFDDRVDVLKDKMRTAEEAVQRYRVENGLVEAGGGGETGRSTTLAGQQMGQINVELTAAAADRTKKQASLDQIGRARTSGAMDAVPEVVASPLIQRLREQEVALGTREAALAAASGPGNPEMKAIHSSQRDIAAQIAAETAKIAASLRSGVTAAQAREASLRDALAQLQSQVGKQGQSEVKLHELQNEAEIDKQMYTSYLKRYEETANQADARAPDATVVSRAGIPLGAAPPSKQQVIAAGVLVSVFLSGLLGLVRERTKSGFRTSEELEAAAGALSLGYVPEVSNPARALRFSDPYSTFSESISSIRALLRLNFKPAKVLMVTSALPREGKTFLSAALARNAALAGERVLLIDCDLRRPGVARNIAATETRIRGNVTLHRDSSSPLDLVTLRPMAASPQDLLSSTDISDLIGTMRDQYDLIVLDTPPVMVVSDALVLVPVVDAVIVAVQWQRTAQPVVNGALAALRNSGAQIAGTVMTQVRVRRLDSADGAIAHRHRNYVSYLTQ